MKKLLIAIIFFTSLQTFAQNLKMESVVGIKLRNTGEITNEENQVQGYFYFYNVEKVDKKNNSYILSIADENLRKVNEITIVKPNSTMLVEAEYNGSAFAFLFYNYKEKFIEIVSYDKSLKLLGSTKKIIKGNYNGMLYNQVAMGMESGFQFLVSVKNKGFLYYGFVETKKYHYSVDCYDNNLKFLWNTTTDPESKEMIIAEAAFQTENIVGSQISRKKGIMSKDMSYDLLVNDLKTGKNIFKVEIADLAYNLSATKITYDEATKNVMVFGEYFDLTDKELKSSAVGYFYLMLDLTGKVVQKKFISWGKDLSKFVKVDQSGKMEKGARIFVHEIIRIADGDIFVIGEQYKKAASGSGIAMKMAAAALGGSSNASTAQLTIMNMVVLQFSSSLDVKSVNIFEKDINRYNLPQGSEFMSSKMLAYYGLSYGWFDYSFYQILKDKNTFVVSFNNYVKEKGEKGQSLLSIIVYTPEKVFTTDKIVLNRKSSECRVGKAKSGYVMVAEYFKKEKNLDVRLEKLTY